MRNLNPVAGYLQGSSVHSPLGGRTRRGFSAIVERAVAGLLRWHRRARERALLAQLDERMLRDLGISRLDVTHELNKPFWRE